MGNVELKKLIDAAEVKGLVAVAERGMIYQVWEDGEVTLQKCGDLLWQRNLHMIQPGNTEINIGDLLPNKDERTGHAWVWVESHDEVDAILAAI